MSAVTDSRPRGRLGRHRRLRAGRILLALYGAVVLAGVAALALLRPGVIAGPVSYVVVSGPSMEPTLETGDLVVVARRDAYARGDVVAYRVPAGQPGAGILVIHRVVGGNGAAGYVLRGDNKASNDPWRPRSADVIGRMRFHVPKVGLLPRYARSRVGLALAAALCTIGIALGGGVPARRRGDLGSR